MKKRSREKPLEKERERDFLMMFCALAQMWPSFEAITWKNEAKAPLHYIYMTRDDRGRRTTAAGRCRWGWRARVVEGDERWSGLEL